MHAQEREQLNLEALKHGGFATYRTLEARLEASPATIRRDLAKLEDAGRIARPMAVRASLSMWNQGARPRPPLLLSPARHSTSLLVSISHRSALSDSRPRLSAGSERA